MTFSALSKQRSMRDDRNAADDAGEDGAQVWCTLTLLLSLLLSIYYRFCRRSHSGLVQPRAPSSSLRLPPSRARRRMESDSALSCVQRMQWKRAWRLRVCLACMSLCVGRLGRVL